MLKPTVSFLIFIRLTFYSLIITGLCRLVFYIFNPSYFTDVGITDFLHGFRFDMISLVFGLIPILIILVIPLKSYTDRLLRVMNVYFLFVINIFALTNFIDVIYYRFTLKRTTWDIFSYVNAGDDFAKLIPQFLKDYYFMIIIWLIFVYLSILAGNRIFKSNDFTEKPSSKILYSLVIIASLIVGSRGGFQLKPLNIIDASRYTSPQNTALLLSTPFSMMKSFGRNQLFAHQYFTEEKARQLFNPVFEIEESDSADKRNIVIIIMESLSKEYIGYFNPGMNYTPFLDSLMQHSIVFENAYANGKRSIEALPAIFSGLPNLMNEAYNTSPYAGNSMSSLALYLKKQGYQSSFFHGGANGTMGFNSYTKLAGFDAYYGKDEYPGKDDFDGLWGIYDVPYFQYVASMQSEMKEPFLSGVFSLSAHHPYKLPTEFNNQCKEGSLEILKMICYSDIALQKYFEKVKKSDWYKRSIFIITADHTAQNVSEKYGTSLGMYAIPFIIYDPIRDNAAVISKTTQQADISPTILHYLNIPGKAIFFGQSAMDSSTNGFCLNFLNDRYQFIEDSICMLFDSKNILDIYNYREDSLLKNNLKFAGFKGKTDSSENKLKAIIQQYNRRMIENDLIAND